MTNLTAVVLVKNEEENVINRCLKSVGFCDEIIMINDASSQKLEVKSQKYNSKFKSFFRKLNGDFAGQRNFGMEKATNDWILFVDADEEVTDELKQELQNLIRQNFQFSIFNFQSFYIRRRDFFWGHEMKYGETMKARNRGIIRLIKKGSGQWQGKVHEEYKLATRNSQLVTSKNFLNHYPHPTVKEFIQSVNFYSSLRAEELYKQGKKTNILQIIFYPLLKFKLTYFLKLGFLDGPAGFAYSFFMSFHSLLVRLKLYQKLYLNNG